MHFKSFSLLVAVVIVVAGFLQDAKATQKNKDVLQSKPYHQLIKKHADAYGVPVDIAHAIVKVESNYHHGVTGKRGEIGLMQLMPKTARGIGYRGPMHELYHPAVNIKWGMKYLAMARERSRGDLCLTVMHYQSGLYAKRISRANEIYCQKVKQYLAEFQVSDAETEKDGLPTLSKIILTLMAIERT